MGMLWQPRRPQGQQACNIIRTYITQGDYQDLLLMNGFCIMKQWCHDNHGYERQQTYNLFVTSKNETTNSPNHEFKVRPNVFKRKKQGLKYFFKGRNKKGYTIKKGFKRPSDLYAAH